MALSNRVRAVERRLGPDLAPRPDGRGGWTFTPAWRALALRYLNEDPAAGAEMDAWMAAHPDACAWLEAHTSPEMEALRAGVRAELRTGKTPAEVAREAVWTPGGAPIGGTEFEAVFRLIAEHEAGEMARGAADGGR